MELVYIWRDHKETPVVEFPSGKDYNEFLEMVDLFRNHHENNMEISAFIKDLIERDTAKKVHWELYGFVGRICPTCGNKSYYCSTTNSYRIKQPDNFCSKCGQRFVVE